MAESTTEICDLPSGDYLAAWSALSSLLGLGNLLGAMKSQNALDSISKQFETERDGNIGIIRFADAFLLALPTDLALIINAPLYYEISAAVDQFALDPTIEGILIVGSITGGELCEELHHVALAISAATISKPVFVLIQDEMSGAGLFLSAHCSRVYATPSSFVGDLNLFHVPEFGGWKELARGNVGTLTTIRRLIASERLLGSTISSALIEGTIFEGGRCVAAQARKHGLIDDLAPSVGAEDYVLRQLRSEIRARGAR